MRILVTGANGLLGHHVVNELLNRGEELRVIIRSPHRVYFDLEKTQSYLADFTNKQKLTEAAAGCDAIIHIAAVTSTNLLHYDDYKRVNVEASRLLIEVAREQSINRIVYVSTSNTIGYGSRKHPSDEQSPIQHPFTESFYAKSKKSAELLFEDFAKDPNHHVVIIHPTFMIGSYDTKPSSGKIVLMGYQKRIVFVPRGGKNFVAVKAVALACCNALTQGKSGEHYLVAGENLSFRKFYKLQRRVGGYKQKIVVLPNLFLKMVGYIGDFIRKMGTCSDLSSTNINQLMIYEHYSSHKTKNELFVPEINLSSAIEDAIDWFKQNEYFTHKIDD